MSWPDQRARALVEALAHLTTAERARLAAWMGSPPAHSEPPEECIDGR